MTEVRTDGLLPTDAELLCRFASEQDEAAFQLLLEKHGGMVWRICQRQLRNREDIEDAFQSTFIVLAKKARSVRKGASIASWLYKVAFNQSVQIVRARCKRAEQAFVEEPEAVDNVFSKLRDREQAMILDEEVSRLPEQLRSALILCCLEGKTRNQAAEELECTDAAVKARLTRGKRLLRMRLARRGIGLSVVLALLTKGAEQASAAPPLSLMESTLASAVATVPQPPFTDITNLLNAEGLASWLRTPLLWALLIGGLAVTAMSQAMIAKDGTEQGPSETTIAIQPVADGIDEKIASLMVTLEQEPVRPDHPRVRYLRVQREVYEQQVVAKGLEIEAYLARGTERAEKLNKRIDEINADALSKLQVATEELVEYATMKNIWKPEDAVRVLADRSLNAAKRIDDARVVAKTMKRWQELQLPGDSDPITSKMRSEEETNPKTEKLE